MFEHIRKFRLFAAVALLALGGFVWAGLTGTRLLGDDNESTENLNGYGGARSGGGSGVRYYHK
ncbi:hypothetical protein [Hymenobacter koreensis]|uniref:Uncharacterized protein n=1 Tax=Hymenobacter koreensis TaxID=1084523 RepID=A0ABP8IV29_9BACT